jgi:hypothetical protein
MSEEITNPTTPNAPTAAVPPAATEERKCVYYDLLTDEEKGYYARVVKSHDLCDEITLLKVKVSYLLAHDPSNLALLVRLVFCIERLARTNHKVFQKEIDQNEKWDQNMLGLLSNYPMLRELAEKKFQ